MTHRKDGGPAFPVPTFGGSVTPFQGMTLRDYFAGQALYGLLACHHELRFAGSTRTELNERDYAHAAYATADAMLARREAVPTVPPVPASRSRQQHRILDQNGNVLFGWHDVGSASHNCHANTGPGWSHEFRTQETAP